MNELVTIMGIRIMELEFALGQILPPAAYKEIKGTRKRGMTDTKAHFVRKRCVEIFGPVGYGWSLEVGEIFSEYNADAKGGNVWTSTVTVKFRYRMALNGRSWFSEPVIGTGGVSMDRKDFAERGAVTNGLGDALKHLGFQAGLWFGKFDHSNAREKYAKQEAMKTKWADEGKHFPGEPLEQPELSSTD